MPMRSVNRVSNYDYQYRHFGGFRLVLAALVMMQHFLADLAPTPLSIASLPYVFGNMAVLAFFALSGFVITEAVDRVYRERPAAFLANRVLRIVPHFILAVALSMLAHQLFRVSGGIRLWRSQPSFPADAFDAVNVALNFISIVPAADRFIHYNFLDIAWAVRVEMAFYLILGGCIAIGRKLPAQRGFAIAASGAMMLLAPLFFLAVQGRGLAMLAFLPYFAFGGGLYFATNRRRSGWLTIALSVPAILWQCITFLTTDRLLDSPSLSLPGNLIVLVVLLSILTALAFSKINRWGKTDRVLGSLTYPLYLYHEGVIVMVLTMTTGYSYGIFTAGILISLITAIALTVLVDPLVNRYRDRVRGRVLPSSTTGSAAAIEVEARGT